MLTSSRPVAEGGPAGELASVKKFVRVRTRAGRPLPALFVCVKRQHPSAPRWREGVRLRRENGGGVQDAVFLQALFEGFQPAWFEPCPAVHVGLLRISSVRDEKFRHGFALC